MSTAQAFKKQSAAVGTGREARTLRSRLARRLPPWLLPLVFTAVGVVYVAANPEFPNSYYGNVATQAAIFTTMVLSLSLLASWSGQWSLGHAAFLALGAYESALLFERGWALEPTLLVVALSGMLLGFIIGIVSPRFSVLYLAIVTMIVALVIVELAIQLSDLTGGGNGKLVFIPTAWVTGGAELTTAQSMSFTIILAGLIFTAAAWMRRTHQLQRWLSVKANPLAAASIGINQRFEQAWSFSLATGVAVTGGLPYAIALGYLTPDTFTFTLAVTFIVAAVVGGKGTLFGALIGGVYIVALPEYLRSAENFSDILFGGSVVVTMLLYPAGLAPLLYAAVRLAKRRRIRTASKPEEVVAKREPVDLALNPLTSDDALTVDKVEVSFGGVKAIDHASLSLRPGTCLGLIGPNGAGKTTLLNAISGFVQPSPGSRIDVGDEQVRGAANRRHRYGIGRTFQHAELFEELTVRQVVELAVQENGLRSRFRPSSPNRHAKGDALIRFMGLEEVAESEAASLPFGVQKLVDVARALALEPRFLLMDEPFSGLDPLEVQIVHELIVKLRAAGLGVLLIDHSVVEVLGLADEIVVLAAGKVIATGTPDEVRKDPAVIASYLGASTAGSETSEVTG